MKRIAFCLVLLAGCCSEPSGPPEPPPKRLTVPCPTEQVSPSLVFPPVVRVVFPKVGDPYYYQGYWYKVVRTGRGAHGVWQMELEMDKSKP